MHNVVPDKNNNLNTPVAFQIAENYSSGLYNLEKSSIRTRSDCLLKEILPACCHYAARLEEES